MADVRLREPGRHLSLDHRSLDGLGPRTRVLIGEKRHRGNLPRPMAALAVLLKDRKDVLVEGNRRGLIGCSGRNGRWQDRKGQTHHKRNSLGQGLRLVNPATSILHQLSISRCYFWRSYLWSPETRLSIKRRRTTSGIRGRITHKLEAGRLQSEVRLFGVTMRRRRGREQGCSKRGH